MPIRFSTAKYRSLFLNFRNSVIFIIFIYTLLLILIDFWVIFRLFSIHTSFSFYPFSSLTPFPKQMLIVFFLSFFLPRHLRAARIQCANWFLYFLHLILNVKPHTLCIRVVTNTKINTHTHWHTEQENKTVLLKSTFKKFVH